MWNDNGTGQPISRPRPLVSPNNMMPVEVIGRAIAAPGVVTLYLAIPGTQQPPAPYVPGQFVTMALPTGTETLYRSYSLCGDGLPDRPWEVTIKRLREGAVSTYMYDEVRVGTLLYASFPRGAFTLPQDLSSAQPLVYIAVGSGITPIMGMIRALALLPPDEHPPVQLHYASRTEDDVIYRDELLDMDPDERWLRQYHYLSSRGERLTGAGVITAVGKAGRRALWYMCGPEPLKLEMYRLLRARGVSTGQILSEVFATQRGATHVDYQIVDAATGDDVAQVRVQATGAVLGMKANETVLAALERHGYRPEASCRAGSCGMCKQHLLSGHVNAPPNIALSNREREAGDILACVSVAQGDIVLESGGIPPVGGVATPIGAGRAASKVLVRAGVFAMASGLLLGAWQLTNHRPLSWDVATAAQQPPPSASPTTTGTNGGAPGATAVPGKPTATPVGGKPAPTHVPGKPGPTATTAPGKPPAPTATTAPGQPPPAPTATTAPPPPAPTATTAPSKHK